MTITRGFAGYIVVTGIVEREGNQFVSHCRELGTSSCGDTVEEAFRNLEDAIEVHLSALEETGEILRVLRERHIRIDLEPSSDEMHEVTATVPPGKMCTMYQRPVATGALT